ncbi:hypothetical protein A3A50_03765 [Candidatus Woesebacteria bacterium RIFCSPLOWO2_01_FULL_38_20]|nr:MAG: hypothetical protein A3A50_03765 [Candidatus Woesebacteria bacterium RIFCSPLOWO2_01_FULL_38_20]
MRRLGGVSRRHRFEMISNLLVKREGWHEFGRIDGRAPIRGQQFVRKIQAKLALLKSERKCAKILKTKEKSYEIPSLLPKINR